METEFTVVVASVRVNGKTNRSEKKKDISDKTL